MNRRRYQRKRVRITVTVDPGGVTSSTGDVSAEGVFVRTGRVLAPGTVVRLVLEMPWGHAWAEGVVRWSKRVAPELLNYSKGGMGIEFTWCSPELTKHLQSISGPECPGKQP